MAWAINFKMTTQTLKKIISTALIVGAGLIGRLDAQEARTRAEITSGAKEDQKYTLSAADSKGNSAKIL